MTKKPTTTRRKRVKKVEVEEAVKEKVTFFDSKPEETAVEPILKAPEPADVPLWVSKLPKGLGTSIWSYAQSVGSEEAIRLAQKLLGIKQSGILDENLSRGWAECTTKKNLIDDYNNSRKDNLHAEIESVRKQSKAEI